MPLPTAAPAPKNPATYLVEENGRPVRVVLTHRPERAIAAVVEPRFTARVISPFELLALQRTHGIEVLDPHGTLPAPALALPSNSGQNLQISEDWRDDCAISIGSDPGPNPQSPLPLTAEPPVGELLTDGAP